LAQGFRLGRAPRRLLAACFLVLLALGLLEGGLRLSGWSIRFSQRLSNPDLDFRPDEFRIVALGESTTAQFWSEGRRAGWVDQLQENLNAAGLGRRFKIVNMAVGGSSTPFLLNDLEAAFPLIKPHAVITMMGINDSNRLEYLNTSSLRIVKLWGWLRGALQPSPEAPSISESDFLRIMEELASGPWAKASRPADLASAPDFVEAVAARHEEHRWVVYERASYFHSNRYNELKGKHRAPMSAGMMDALLESCRRYALRSRELNPLHLRTLMNLIVCSSPYPEKHEEARRGLRLSMDAGAQLHGPIFNKLEAIEAQNDPVFLAALERHGLRHAPARPWIETTRDSYRLLADRLKSRGVVFLAMQYPTGNPDAIRNYFAVNFRDDFERHRDAIHGRFPGLEILPRYSDVLVISNENFNKIITKENFYDYFTDSFGGSFGHTTRAGHALVARNAADFIIAHWAEISARAPR
jgi:lysophospholipase L1-like esterase